MKVLIVIPVYNEEKRLGSCIAKLHHYLANDCALDYEVAIVENGSTDGTLALARALAQRHSRTDVKHIDLNGRGRALKQAWTESGADILSYMDVDLSTHLSCFAPLITALASGRFDVGTGSRFLPQSSTTRCWRRQCVSATYNRLVRLYFGITFSDAQCGFKAITKAAAARLLPVIEDNGWFFDTELLVVAEKCGYRIFDLPVCWTEDRDSRVRIISTAWGDLKGILQLKRNFLDGRYSHVNAVSANAGLIGTL